MPDPNPLITVPYSQLRSLQKSNARLWQRLSELETIMSKMAGAPLPLKRTTTTLSRHYAMPSWTSAMPRAAPTIQAAAAARCASSIPRDRQSGERNDGRTTLPE
jgi:hypothetical protein